MQDNSTSTSIVLGLIFTYFGLFVAYLYFDSLWVLATMIALTIVLAGFTASRRVR